MNGWRLPLLTLLGQAAVISVAALTSSSVHQAHEVTGLGQACKLKNVDAVVVLDSSMSVGAEHWQELLKLTKQFGDTLDSSAGHSRLGLVSYSDSVTVLRKLQKIPSGTAQFEEELGAASFMNGNTFTPKALDSAYELFKETIHEDSEGAEDQEKRRLLLLATDGCADIYGKEYGSLEHHYRAAVGNLDKVPHLHTLVLGIGKQVCVEELRYIAGCDPRSLDAPCPSLLLTSWDSLQKDLRRLDKDVCEEITMEEKEDQEMPPVVPETPEISTTTCHKGRVDAVAVLDGSGSISRADWKKTRDIAKLFSGALNIAEDQSHVSVVRFSTTARADWSLVQPVSWTEKQLTNRISRLPQPYGGTNTPAALEEAYKIFVTSMNNRDEHDSKHVHRVLLLATDGCVNQWDRFKFRTPEAHLHDVLERMSSLKNLHIKVLGIGKSICHSEIRLIAGCDPKGTESCRNAKYTDFNSVLDELPEYLEEICEEVEHGVLPPVSSPEDVTIPSEEPEGGPPAEEEEGGLQPPTEGAGEEEGFPPTEGLPGEQPPVPEEPGEETPGAGPLPEEHPPTEAHPPTEEEGGQFEPSTEGECEREEYTPETQPPTTEEPGEETPGAGPLPEEHPPIEELPPTEEEGGELEPPTEGAGEEEGFPPTEGLPGEQPPVPEEPGEEAPGAGPLPEEHPPIEELPPTEEEGGELEPPTEGAGEEEGFPPTEGLPGEQPPMPEEPGEEAPGVGPLPEEHPPIEELPPTEEGGGELEPPTEGAGEEEGFPPTEGLPGEQPPMPEEPGEEAPGAGPLPEEHPPIEELPPTEEGGGELEPPTEGAGEEEGFPPTEGLPGEQPPVPEEPGEEAPGAGPLPEEHPPIEELPPTEEGGGELEPPTEGAGEEEGFPPTEGLPGEQPPVPEEPGEEAPGAGPLPEEHPPIEELPPTEEGGGELEPPTEGAGEEEGFPPTEGLPGEQPPMPEEPGEEAPGAGPLPEGQPPPSEEGGFMPPSAGGAEETTPLPPAEESTPSETEPFPEIPEELPEAAEKEEEGGAPIAAIAGGIIGGVLLLGAAGAGAYALLGGGGAAAAAGSADAGEAVTQGEGAEEAEDREVGIDIDEDMFAVDEM